MTADQVKGKGFKGALSYNLSKVEKGVAEILSSTFSKEDEMQTILKEVNLVRMQRPNLAKYFYHTSLNFPVNEDLKDEQMKTIAGDYLKAMGFGDNQHIIFRHYDADHPHLHILVNRIGYDNSLVSDSRDYQRSENALRQLEKKYGLTEVIGSKEAKERAMTKDEWEMMKRTQEPSAKMKVQELVKGAMSNNPDIQTFISRLEHSGINVLFNQASTGFVSGISYGYEGMQFKGAHLGNAYKWQAIKTATGYEQERDRAAIHEANVRTENLREQRGATERGNSKIQRARTGRIIGAGTDSKSAQDRATDVRQGIGKLQEQHERSGTNIAQPGTDRRHRDQPGLPDQDDRKQRGANPNGTEQGGQQVGHKALHGSDFISDLLGTGHPDNSVAPLELTQRRRKRKKKRGRSL